MGIFNKVDPAVRYRRNPFPMIDSTQIDANIGELIPVFARQMIPTDIFKLSAKILIRFMPMFAPEFTEVNAYVHFMFVPYRLLSKYFPEKYGTEDDVAAIITGGEGAFDPETMTNEVSDEAFPCHTEINIPKGSIGDALGFPTGVTLHDVPEYWEDFIKIIYNEFYRNEVLQDKLGDETTLASNLLVRNWAKDYFTSCLPTQQKGIAPALPLTGTSNAQFDNVTNTPTQSSFLTLNANSDKTLFVGNNSGATDSWKNALSNNVVDFAEAGTFDVADIRNVFAIQRIMERANRCGSRYTEFIQANFGINPGDVRMNRPEYVGGCKAPIMVSQVLQNSSTTVNSPQGNMAGHGIGYSGEKIGTYVAKEFGVMIGFLSLLPKASYQQGIDKEKMWKNRWDFPNPSFQNLSEQPVYNWQLYCDGTSDDNKVFGFQGIYNELRTGTHHTCGNFRDNLDFWHLGRKFSERPTLSDAFLKCQPEDTTRIFNGVDPTKYKNVLIDCAIVNKSLRPLVVHPVPAYLDHN